MLLKGKSIFIVEDNIQNRIVFQMSTVIHGAQVEFERWGKDAVARLKGLKTVDLIILDLMLYHGVSGYDIYDEIRALPKYDHVPIIAVSASEPSIAIPKTRAKGFAGFIAKPIDDSLFPRQLAQVISGEQIWCASQNFVS